MSSTGQIPEQWVDEIVKGLADKHIFPRLSLDDLEEGVCLSLGEIQKLPFAKDLLKIFSDAHLKASLGYNQSSNSISVLCTVPADDPPVHNAQSLLVWTMLHLLHGKQGLFESMFREKVHGKMSACNTDIAQVTSVYRGCSKGIQEEDMLLANRCLMHFMDCTHLAIIGKKISCHLGRLTLTFDTVERKMKRRKDGAVFTDHHMRPLEYSPAYTQLSAFDATTKAMSDELYKQRRAELVEAMVEDLWRIAEQRHYMVAPSLREVVTRALRDYFSGGIESDGCGFEAKGRCLDLYFYGAAGIGKSSFVRIFGDGVRTVIQRYLDCRKDVRIVRVPLNAITPASLSAILNVRGISDWSIERIVEQSISKGDIVILHLEECPEDLSLQEQLHALVEKLRASLIARYPEYEANILHFTTSNYTPCKALEALADVILVRAPSPEFQRKWCKVVIHNDILLGVNKSLPNSDRLLVNVDLEKFDVKVVDDMRKLERFRLWLSFYCIKHSLRELDALQHSFSERNLKEVQEASSMQCRRAQREVVVAISGSFEEVIVQITIQPALEECPCSDDVQPASVSFAPRSSTLHFVVDDNFFVYPKDTYHALVSCQSSADYKIGSIIEMAYEGIIQPAVIVWRGRGTTTVYDKIMKEAEERAGGADKVRKTDVCIESEDDMDRVFGDASAASLGGLFLFIDGVTNPVHNNLYMLGIVFARVNAFGQFALRELLESGDSETHRTRVQKGRIIFALELLDDCPLTLPVESRCHLILE